MSVRFPEQSTQDFFHVGLLGSNPGLDSDDSEADEERPARRMWALSEEEWKDGVQELREKSPHLFDTGIEASFHSDLCRDSEADEERPARRVWTLSEEEWKDGVQELREKSPHLVGTDASAKSSHSSSQELREERPLGRSAEALTYPRRPPRRVKVVSRNQASTDDEPHEREKFSPANLLNACRLLESSDSEEACSIGLAKRSHVLMEKEFTAGVQELREKRPQLFSPSSTGHLRKSSKGFAPYPRKLPRAGVRPLSIQHLPSLSSKRSDDAGGGTATGVSPFERLEPCVEKVQISSLPSSLRRRRFRRGDQGQPPFESSDDKPAVEKVAGPGQNTS